MKEKPKPENYLILSFLRINNLFLFKLTFYKTNFEIKLKFSFPLKKIIIKRKYQKISNQL